MFGLASDAFEFSGYYKNFFTVFDQPDVSGSLSSQPVIGAVNNRLRLSLSYQLSDRLSFGAAYDFSPRVQDRSLFEEGAVFVAIDPSAYRFADLDSRLYPDERDAVASFGIFQNMDRALITLHVPAADVYIGRQAIAWGSGRVLNPTDVIAPYTYEALDTEDRIGVDALRVRVPIGVLGEFDAGYIWGEDADFENSAFFLRSQLNAVETDVSVLLVGFRENFLVGFDLARAIGGAGFWFEGGYVFADAFDDSEAGDGGNYFRSSIGLDYSFGGRTYGFIEYHFNQAGAKDPADYLTNLAQPAYTDGAVYLMGEHYLAPGLTYQITPLVIFSVGCLFNVSHPSVFVSPQVEYNVAQDIYVSAGAFVGIGAPPESVTTTDEEPTQRLRSEFGAYPDTFFSSFRIYF